MVDAAPFSHRLDAALAMNGLSNRDFAALINPHTGQQTVNGWRRRGRVGAQSVKRVRALLPKTNFDWLQEGVGEPERFNGVAESSPNYDVRQSYSTRLPPSILAQAVRVVEVEEHVNGPNPPLRHAIMLLTYADRIGSGEEVADLIAEITDGNQRGEAHGGDNEAGARGPGR
jgi:hypothetical protein